jgi:hypothetical protein
MYAWEIPFRNVVKEARKKEVDQIQWASYIRGIYLSTMVFTERSTLFIAILACIYEGKAITADLVFSMATFFNVLQLTAAIFYPLAVSLGAEALVSFVFKKLTFLSEMLFCEHFFNHFTTLLLTSILCTFTIFPFDAFDRFQLNVFRTF